MDSTTGAGVQALLLKEAQQEIANLRTELYSTRRLAEDRRVKLEGLTGTNEALTRKVGELEGQIASFKQQEQRYKQIDLELKQLRETYSQLHNEHVAVVKSRDGVVAALNSEKNAKQAAEAAKAILESDRSRLQKSKDELLAQLRLAKLRVAEAEEEQVKAEQDAAHLRSELAAFQSQHGRSPTVQSRASPLSHSNNQDIVVLVEQLEHERTRAANLSAALNNLKVENFDLRRELEESSNQSSEVQTLKVEVDALQHELNKARSELLELQSAARAKSASERAQMATPIPTQRAEVEAKTAECPADSDKASSLQVEVDNLTHKMNMYKTSRDKLLSEVDGLSQEVDRLLYENKLLAHELQQNREIAQKWEHQAQDGMVQVDKLKDLLEESATWQLSGRNPSNQNSTDGAVSDPALAIQSELLQEKARAADLELQVRALAGELVRNHNATLELRNSVLPVLKGFETKLSSIVTKAGAAAEY